MTFHLVNEMQLKETPLCSVDLMGSEIMSNKRIRLHDELQDSWQFSYITLLRDSGMCQQL
jgi:hypothetical protein